MHGLSSVIGCLPLDILGQDVLFSPKNSQLSISACDVDLTSCVMVLAMHVPVCHVSLCSACSCTVAVQVRAVGPRHAR